jgi:hypothetical protein
MKKKKIFTAELSKLEIYWLSDRNWNFKVTMEEKQKHKSTLGIFLTMVDFV